MAVNLGSAYGEIEIGTGEAQQSVASLADQMRSVGTRMSLAITAPLALVGKAGLEAAGAFEQAFNQIQVISGATGEQFEALQGQALELGAQTSFSAGEAADAMLELSKAGLTVEQVMAAVPGVLDLAAAGGLGLGQAAEIAANALNAFKLPAEETANVANMLAAAANASSVDVKDLADAFTMSAAVFASNGQSMEEMTSALALLGNNAIKGSDAGTSLKQMLLSLTAPTEKAAGVLADLGVQVYNADGSMRSFRDIVANLETATAGLSDAQRNQALATVFGSDAIRAANILIAEGVDSFDEMTTSVTRAGAAQEVANARMQGLTGAVEYFKGSMESALIGAFQPFLGGLSDMIRTIADVISKFGELDPQLQTFIITFGAVMAAVGPALVTLPMLAGVIGALASPIGLVAAGLAALAAAWVSDWGGIQGKTQEAWEAIQPALQELGEVLETTLVAALETLQGVWNEVWPALQAAFLAAWPAVLESLAEMRTWLETTLPAALGALQAKWTEIWGIVGPRVQAAWDAMAPAVEGLRAWLAETLPVALETVQTAFTTVWGAVPGILQAAWDGMGPALERMFQFFEEDIPGALETLQGVFEAAFAGMAESAGTWQTRWGETVATVQAVWGQLVEFFTPTAERLVEAFGEMIEGFAPLGPKFQEMVAAAQPLVEMLGVLLVAAVDLFLNAVAGVMPQIPVIIGAAMDQATAALNLLTSTVGGVVELVKALIAGDWQAAWTAAGSIVQGFADFGISVFTNLSTVITAILTAIFDTVTGTLEDMGVDVAGILDTLERAWSRAWEMIRQATETAVGEIVGVLNAIRVFVTETLPNALSAFRRFLASLNLPNPFAALLGAIEAIQGAISAAKSAIQSFKDWIGSIHIPNPFGGISLPSIPGFAQGTLFAPGGPALVGEEGPEIVQLPRGARVFDAPATRQMLGEGEAAPVYQFHIYNDIDWEEAAWRVTQIQKRNRG